MKAQIFKSHKIELLSMNLNKKIAKICFGKVLSYRIVSFAERKRMSNSNILSDLTTYNATKKTKEFGKKKKKLLIPGTLHYTHLQLTLIPCRGKPFI
jgi:hypothetical protein